MSLIGLIVVLVVIGVILWAVNAYIPMDPAIKKLLTIVVIVVVVLWLLSTLGFLQMADIQVGRVR